MSKQDYVKFADLFAGEIATYRNGGAAHVIIPTVRRLILSTADIFAQDSPRFDRARFYVACGLTADGLDIGPRLPM